MSYSIGISSSSSSSSAASLLSHVHHLVDLQVVTIAAEFTADLALLCPLAVVQPFHGSPQVGVP